MKPSLNRVPFWVLPRGVCVVLLLATAGCNRAGEVKMQRVPKDADSAPAAMQPPAMASAADAGGGQMPADFHATMNPGAGAAQIKWTVPPGWAEKALSQMRVGSFNATGKNGQVVDVSVIPLPAGGPQMELANLNMWRSELQVPALDRSEASPVTIGSAPGKWFEMSGGQPASRIVVAAIDHDGMTWYFKMRGDDATVLEQKPNFLEFLKSVAFETASQPAMPANPHAFPGGPAEMAAAPADGGDKPATWTVPAGWQELPATQFLVGKYQIPGANGAKAEVNVSMLSREGGGVMPNINRWRGQIGLPMITQEEDYSKLAQSIDLPDGKGVVVDMDGPGKTGQPTRLVGVIVPKSGQTWFYKLMGDEQIVGQQKDAFLKFVQSAKY